MKVIFLSSFKYFLPFSPVFLFSRSGFSVLGVKTLCWLCRSWQVLFWKKLPQLCLSDFTWLEFKLQFAVVTCQITVLNRCRRGIKTVTVQKNGEQIDLWSIIDNGDAAAAAAPKQHVQADVIQPDGWNVAWNLCFILFLCWCWIIQHHRKVTSDVMLKCLTSQLD